MEITDETIDKLFQGTNFGTSGETPDGRRGLMVECVMKTASGYADGYTITQICKEAGLLNAKSLPNPKSIRWAFNQIYESGPTIIERLKKTKA